MALRSYRELVVRRVAIELVLAVYRVTRAGPSDERFGLTALFEEELR